MAGALARLEREQDAEGGKEASLRWGSARETMNVVVDAAFA